jgi:hypothetical protein
MRNWSSKSLRTRSISAFSISAHAVLLDAVAGEHLHVDDRAVHARGTRSEVSFTSEAFSPKIARSSFSSGVSWVSPLGVTLPTRMSPAFTSAPM